MRLIRKNKNSYFVFLMKNKIKIALSIIIIFTASSLIIQKNNSKTYEQVISVVCDDDEKMFCLNQNELNIQIHLVNQLEQKLNSKKLNLNNYKFTKKWLDANVKGASNIDLKELRKIHNKDNEAFLGVKLIKIKFKENEGSVDDYELITQKFIRYYSIIKNIEDLNKMINKFRKHINEKKSLIIKINQNINIQSQIPIITSEENNEKNNCLKEFLEYQILYDKNKVEFYNKQIDLYSNESFKLKEFHSHVDPMSNSFNPDIFKALYLKNLDLIVNKYKFDSDITNIEYLINKTYLQKNILVENEQTTDFKVILNILIFSFLLQIILSIIFYVRKNSL
jgi:hypothetical protein